MNNRHTETEIIIRRWLQQAIDNPGERYAAVSHSFASPADLDEIMLDELNALSDGVSENIYINKIYQVVYLPTRNGQEETP